MGQPLIRAAKKQGPTAATPVASLSRCSVVNTDIEALTCDATRWKVQSCIFANWMGILNQRGGVERRTWRAIFVLMEIFVIHGRIEVTFQISYT